jgi:hypothetical protein
VVEVVVLDRLGHVMGGQGDAVGERHAQHRRPRALVHRLDGADWLRVQADPLLGADTIEHEATMASRDEPRRIRAGG